MDQVENIHGKQAQYLVFQSITLDYVEDRPPGKKKLSWE
jgi:hypothetical protein